MQMFFANERQFAKTTDFKPNEKLLETFLRIDTKNLNNNFQNTITSIPFLTVIC